MKNGTVAITHFRRQMITYSLFDIYLKPFHFAINIALDKERNSVNSSTIACIMLMVNVRTCASNYPFELGM